jgi:hypothetical protein
MPSHGLSEHAMETSVDISQYVGQDQSIFRPLKTDEHASTPVGSDPLSQLRRRSEVERDPASDIPENTRLFRSLAAGMIISVVLALVQYIAVRETPTQLYYLTLGRGTGFLVAVKYGLATGLILGLGLGAILTKLKRGSFLGALLGVLVGSGFGNAPWAQIAGALTGIVAGRFATIGVRRTVQI